MVDERWPGRLIATNKGQFMRQQRYSASGASGPRRSLESARRGAFAALALAALLIGSVASFIPLTARSASADGRPPGGALSDPVVRAVDVAAPSVVRLATLYTAKLFLFICGASVTLPISGAPYTVGALGSGAFVSANGDILTAGHLVDVDKATLTSELFQGGRSSRDIAILLNNNAACLRLPFAVTADDVANGVVQTLGILTTPSFSPPAFYVWQSTNYSGQLTTSGSSQGELATLLAAPNLTGTLTASSPFEQDDVALLRVSVTDTPSIQLGDATSVAAQDRLTIVGFPGNGDLDPSLGGLDPTNLLTPSVNVVTVSAIKKNKNGSRLIQVGGNVEHGDSGGPALDDQGHIVGVVSFGGPDTQGITAFLRSSESAQALMKTNGIDTKPGAFQTAWQQAFADYAATYPGHWRKAAAEMNALSEKYPDFGAVKPYKAFATTSADHEPVNESTQAPNLLAIGVATGVGVLLLGILIALIVASQRRSRQRRLAAAQAAMTPQYAPGYPYPPYAQPTVPRGDSGQYPPQYSPAYPPTYPGYPPTGLAPTGVATPPGEVSAPHE
jgi:hypothetical protein